MDDNQSKAQKIGAFKNFCKENTAVFSIIENGFSRNKIQEV